MWHITVTCLNVKFTFYIFSAFTGLFVSVPFHSKAVSRIFVMNSILGICYLQLSSKNMSSKRTVEFALNVWNSLIVQRH